MPAIAWAILILIVSTLPNPPSLGPQGSDKVVHFALFFIQGALCVPALLALKRPGARALATFALILVFAALDEALQLVVPGRFASIDDWMANALGAAAGLSLAAIPQLRRRNSR